MIPGLHSQVTIAFIGWSWEPLFTSSEIPTVIKDRLATGYAYTFAWMFFAVTFIWVSLEEKL